jgi:hypothetical protein
LLTYFSLPLKIEVVLVKTKVVWDVTLDPEDKDPSQSQDLLAQGQSVASHSNGIVTHASALLRSGT